MLILRDYQHASQDALRVGIKNGHVRQVLCAATGAGKSIIMLSMIKSAQEKGSKVLFLCERRILVKQFSEHLLKHHIDHGIIMAGTWRHRPDELVQVASMQTIEKMELFPSFDICFVDEIHAAMRKSLVSLIKARPNLKIIGATATPFNHKLADHFSNVVNVVSMKQLIDEEHLVPFRVFSAHEIDVKGLKIDTTGEFEKHGLEQRGMTIVGDVVSDYIRLTEQVFGEQRKGICFSCGVAHGQELARKFNENGVYAVQISYKDSDEFKADVLAEFAKPDTQIKILISSDILERGFDQSDIDFVILAKAVKKSFSKFVQMIGRGARPNESKEFCCIQDHGSNWLRFAEQWNELFHNGVTELTSTPDKSNKPEPSELVKKESSCPKCGCHWGNSEICPQCGCIRVRKNKVETKIGEMKELISIPPSQKYSDKDREAWYRGLLFIQRSSKKKDGTPYSEHWADMNYKEKFGDFPKYSKIAEPPRPEIQAWLTHKLIAFRKGRKR